MSFLPNVDHIIVLENGSILDQGNYKDLIQKNTLSNLPVLDSDQNKPDDISKLEEISLRTGVVDFSMKISLKFLKDALIT